MPSGTLTTMTTDAKPPIDWAAIEIDYRAGMKPLRQIASEHSITHGAVNQKAKRSGWERDLKAKIAAKAEAKLSKAAVSDSVSKAKAVSERVVVEANAEAQMRIRLAHRTDIAAVRKLCMSLFAELERESRPEQIEALENLGDLMRAPDARGMDKLNEVYRAVIALPERTKTLKALAESMRMLIALEREAFGIVVAADEGPKGVDAAEVVRLLAAQLPD